MGAELTCATFLADYDAVAVRIEPLTQFSRRPDLVIAMKTSCGNSEDEALAYPQGRKPVSKASICKLPNNSKPSKQYSMCINCMLCYAACPVYG